MADRRKRWDVILDRLPQGIEIVGAEVGVWNGKTTSRLLPARPLLRLYAIDAWAPAREGDSYYLSGAHDAYWTPAQFEQERALYRKRCARWMNRVTELRGDFAEMADRVTEPLDFVFLDADHSMRGTLRAIEAWEPKVKPGGWVFMHDVGPTSKFEGPEAAARIYFGDAFDRGTIDSNHTFAWRKPV